MLVTHWSHILILGISILGIAFNICGFVMLTIRNKNSMFFLLLKVLAVYDSFVVVGCCSLFSIPDLWMYYKNVIYPQITPYVMPLVYISVMSSVYCTILMSFERYLRICYICQLQYTSMMSKAKFNKFLLTVVLFPILFYLPKFFEIRSIVKEKTIEQIYNCSNYSLLPFVNNSSDDFIAFQCQDLLRRESGTTMSLNLTQTVVTFEIAPTPLRSNPYYYKFYCVFLNTLFATFIPLLSLFYLNISTVLTLRRIKKYRMNFENRYPDSGRFYARSPRNSESQVGLSENRHNSGFRASFNFVMSHNEPGSSAGRAYRTLVRASPGESKSEDRLTRISLTIVWMFLLCHIWKLIPTTYEMFTMISSDPDTFTTPNFPSWVQKISDLSHTLIVLNSTINFLLYVIL